MKDSVGTDRYDHIEDQGYGRGVAALAGSLAFLAVLFGPYIAMFVELLREGQSTVVALFLPALVYGALAYVLVMGYWALDELLGLIELFRRR